MLSVALLSVVLNVVMLIVVMMIVVMMSAITMSVAVSLRKPIGTETPPLPHPHPQPNLMISSGVLYQFCYRCLESQKTNFQTISQVLKL